MLKELVTFFFSHTKFQKILYKLMSLEYFLTFPLF